MLAKKKQAKKASIASFVKDTARAKNSAKGMRVSREDAQDASFDPTALIRSIGDDVNTRLQDIAAEEDIDPDVFDQRRLELMEEAQLAAGTRQRVVSDSLEAYFKSAAAGEQQPVVRVRHNCNAVTAVASLGTSVVVFGDKTGKVFVVDLASHEAGQRLRKTMLEPPLPAAVTAIAVSDTRLHRPSARELFERTTVDMSCQSYIAVGAADGSISVWETFTRRHKGLLTMHRKAVTGLSFRQLTATLYSSSDDGTLRVWSVPVMMAVDKLFGHEGRVAALHGLRRETCASVGEDGTMRFWKMESATQQAYDYLLEYRSPDSAAPAPAGRKPTRVAMGAVAMVSETLVAAGGEDGSLLLFDINRRRPLVVIPEAHGKGFVGDGTGLECAAMALDGSANTAANPITALASVPYADVIASAGYDGVVRIWKVSPNHNNSSGGKSAISLLVEVPLVPRAIVTSLAFSPDGEMLFVANSKEPKRGRWVTLRAALNSVTVVPVSDASAALVRGMPRDVEHVPAQLFGFVDDENEEAQEEEEEEEEEQEGGALGAPHRRSPAMLPMSLPADEEDEEMAAPAASSRFAIGEDGQLVMQEDPSAFSTETPERQRSIVAASKQKKNKSKSNKRQAPLSPPAREAEVAVTHRVGKKAKKAPAGGSKGMATDDVMKTVSLKHKSQAGVLEKKKKKSDSSKMLLKKKKKKS